MAERCEVSAIMVTFNSADVAPHAVDALLGGSQVPARIVIVDNASSDQDYLAGLESISERVVVVRSPTNTGFCAANNRGASMAPWKSHLLLVNPDAFVTPHFVRDALAALDADPTVGAIGPKLLEASRSGAVTGRLDSAGIAQTRFGRFYDRGQGEPDAGQFDARTDAEALCAAAVLIRAEAVVDIGGPKRLFDPRFFMYKEDIDLSFRLRRAGWRVVFDPSLIVLHCRGWNRDRRRSPAWARRMSVWNEWRLWRKGWTPGRTRLSGLPYLALKTVAVLLGR